MIYLASPFTSDNPNPERKKKQEYERYIAACRFTAAMMIDGHDIFSPIVHSYWLATQFQAIQEMPHDFWMEVDRPFIAQAKEVWVLRLSGWQSSRGVQAEIRIAAGMGKPIKYVDVADYEAQPCSYARELRASGKSRGEIACALGMTLDGVDNLERFDRAVYDGDAGDRRHYNPEAE